MTSAIIYRTADLFNVMRIESVGRIRDLLWSANSKWLTVLESTDRMEKTPWGLLAEVSGHPIELQTSYVTRIDVETSSILRVKIADDVARQSSGRQRPLQTASSGRSGTRGGLECINFQIVSGPQAHCFQTFLKLPALGCFCATRTGGLLSADHRFWPSTRARWLDDVSRVPQDIPIPADSLN